MVNRVLAYAPTVLCIGFAGAIVVAWGPQADGYGWFLLVALMLVPSSNCGGLVPRAARALSPGAEEAD